MQFAGQRTNEHLELVGEPDNILVAIADDVIPEPDAILVHGITPQITLQDGMSEAQFAAYFHEKVALQDTVFVGFNNIRFDDEFMRKMCYRTFYDPYQWHWKDGRSRWDLLDPLRMMRALRPDGIKWPFYDGKPTVKLELLAKENGIVHENAHDALSDVLALIGIAQLFKTSQPKLFDFLLKTRDKKRVAEIAETGTPFVYTSGKYSSDHEKTTIVQMICPHPKRSGAIVWDLRYDPNEWADKSAKDLVMHWRPAYGQDIKRLPAKSLQYNRCPAIAPLSVLEPASKERIGIDDAVIEKNQQSLIQATGFCEQLEKAIDILDGTQQAQFALQEAVDDQLYGGFWTEADTREMLAIRMADPVEYQAIMPTVKNSRIRDMIPLYKARNFPNLLSTEERDSWDAFRLTTMQAGGKNSPAARYERRMSELGTRTDLTTHQEFLLTELQLYVESIVPQNDV